MARPVELFSVTLRGRPFARLRFVPPEHVWPRGSASPLLFLDMAGREDAYEPSSMAHVLKALTKAMLAELLRPTR